MMKKIFLLTTLLLILSAGLLYADESWLREHRIVGGQKSLPYAWTWMAALITPAATPYYGFFCGATLIHPHWVMTAAHCVKDDFGDDLLPEDIEVVLNIYDLKKETGDRVKIRRIISHPKHDLFEGDDFDIALIELEQDVRYQPLALWSDKSDIQGKTSVVIGWGYTNRIDPDQLMEVQMPVISNDRCNAAYNEDGSYGIDSITQRMLCAGEDGKDSCSGDSGGPLIIKDNTGAWRQAGIVSWGSDPCAMPGLYGVYSRVSEFADFISQYVALSLDAPKLKASVSGTQLTLSWTPVFGAQGYTLYYAPYPNAIYIKTVEMGNITSVSGYLWQGAAFYTALQAYGSGMVSAYSNIESFVINAPSP